MTDEDILRAFEVYDRRLLDAQQRTREWEQRADRAEHDRTLLLASLRAIVRAYDGPTVDAATAVSSHIQAARMAIKKASQGVADPPCVVPPLRKAQGEEEKDSQPNAANKPITEGTRSASSRQRE